MSRSATRTGPGISREPDMTATAAMLDGREDAALFGRGKGKARAPNRRPETGVQIAIIRRVTFHGIVCVHVKNEGVRSMFGHVAAKREGMLPGFPDLVAMQSPGRVAFLEVKEPNWKPPTAKAKGKDAQHYRRQCDAHDMLRRLGFWAGFVTDQDMAVAALREAGFKC